MNIVKVTRRQGKLSVTIEGPEEVVRAAKVGVELFPETGDSDPTGRELVEAIGGESWEDSTPVTKRWTTASQEADEKGGDFEVTVYDT